MKRLARRHPKHRSLIHSRAVQCRRRDIRRQLRVETLEKRHLLAGAQHVEFQTELTELNLSGGPFPLPLATDVSNAFGDSVEGYGFVNSIVEITLSSQRAINPGPASTGFATGFPGQIFGDEEGPQQGAFASQHINPNDFDGQPFFVESFFDVFFDITVTDVDPRLGRDFASGTPSIVIQDVGPANLQSFSGELEPIIFDKDAPNYGLLPPPEAEPYIGHFEIEIPLGGDINGNGEDDKIKFTLATHSAGDENRQFIVLPDGTTIDQFNTAAFLEGAVVDVSTDPPFTIGSIDPQTGLPDPKAFGGPTTATADAIQPIIEEDVFEFGLAEIELIHPDQTREIVKLAGSNTVHVLFEGDEGDAADDDGDNLDEVQTEMVALSLRGNSSLGPLEVRLNPLLQTLGEIEELVDNNTGRLDIDPFHPGDADSFFDVFFEVEVGGQILHTNEPKRMATVITEKPPTSGDVYQSPDTIPLLDAAGLPTGFAVGSSRHEPNPEIEIDSFPTTLAQLTLRDPGGNLRHATLTGPTTVHVNIPPDGTAVDTDGDFFEQVPTEIVELNLSGISDLGPIEITLNPMQRSRGEIEELDNQTPGVLDVAPFTESGLADSFFDVFVQVRVGNSVLHNQNPIRMQSTISHKPPAMGEEYFFVGAIELFDEMNNPTGFVLESETHIPDPGEIDRFDRTVAEVVLQRPDLTTEKVTLVGPTIVRVDIPPDGAATDSNGNNRDDVGSQIVDMFLQGNSSLGPVIVRQSRNIGTFGVIEELVDNNTGKLDVDPFAPGDADSFFDVFIDFEVPSVGVSLHNEAPISLQTVITNKPPNPGDRYVFETPVQLLDASGFPTGFSLLKEIHHPNPPIEVDDFPLSVGDIELELADGSVEQISLVGPSTVNVFFDGPNHGDAIDDDGNGRDEVPAQLVDLQLQGNSSLGPLTVRLNTGVPSLGQIEENVNNESGRLDLDPFHPGDADSFFDVFFEIEVAGATIFNLDPARIEATIDHKPPGPGNTYRSRLSNPVDLFRFDAQLGQLVPAGRLLRERHLPNTTVEVDNFPNTVGQILVDVGATPGVITPDPNLPPSHGDYRTAADVHATYDGGALLAVLERIEHRAFADTAIRTPSGPDEIESFDSSLRGIAVIDGESFPVELTGPVQVISFGKVGNETGTFNTEIISMDLTGSIPGGPVIVIRESPGQTSPGQTTITDLGGGQFQIDSFFDVFTEISIDRSPFIPSTAGTRVDLVESGVGQESDQLPPTDGVYRTAAEVHTTFTEGEIQVILEEVAHQRFRNVQRTPVGDDEVERFDSTVTGRVTIVSPVINGTFPLHVNGAVETLVTDGAVRSTGTFQTEILSMDLSGQIPGGPTILVRESPNESSLGTTRITDLGDRTFNVDSFFDIYTEISVDGGATWIPADGPAAVELVPPREHIVVLGGSTANVYFEGPFEGDAQDDDGDGRDEVETELTQLNLHGNSALGPIEVRLAPGTRSVGRIEELSNDNPGLLDVDPFAPGDADSFFDVFFEVDFGDGFVLHPQHATRLQTTIDTKPPKDGASYQFNPPRPVPILDAAGNPTGLSVVTEIHDVDPTIEVDVFPETLAEIDLLMPSGQTETVNLRGPSTVHVFFEGVFEGDARDDNSNGLDEVPTELVELSLTGESSLGPVIVSLDPNFRSIGSIEELVNNSFNLLDVDPFAPGSANSFFDVFFEIQVGGNLLRGAQNAHLEAQITNKPPDVNEMFVTRPGDEIVLLDERGLDTGIRVTRIKHTPVPALDYGDAPDPRYPTLLANDGARHVIVPGLNLGAAVDAEPDGQPDPFAVGDDIDTIFTTPGDVPFPPGDEDGVVHTSQLLPGQPAFVDVTVTGSGLLNGWIDFADDGSWAQPGDQIFTDLAVGPGLNSLSFVVPAGTKFGAEELFARYRLSDQPGLSFDGFARSGEVEDHLIDVCETTVTNTADGGIGSLRQAITCANAIAGVQTIDFNIPGAGSHQINPLTILPIITDPVIIDAKTQPGYSGTPLVQLDGNDAITSGLVVTSGGSSILGLSVTSFTDAGIFFFARGGNTAGENYVGIDPAGVGDGNFIGVKVVNSPDNDIVSNVVSGNGRIGVFINGVPATGNVIDNNIIGADPTGTVAVPNRKDGVSLFAPGNIVTGNLISGNSYTGIFTRFGYGGSNTIDNNWIGVDATGTVPLGNTLGILLRSPNNVVDANTVSGNLHGVVISGTDAKGNLVTGNLLGTDPGGTAAIGNGIYGVSIVSAQGNAIGNSLPGGANVISGNGLDGILLATAATTGNFVQNNLIGVDITGTVALANGGDGVRIVQGASSNTVRSNQISGNVRRGIAVDGATVSGNRIISNRIGTNATATAPIHNGNDVGILLRAPNTLVERNVISAIDAAITSFSSFATGNTISRNNIGINPSLATPIGINLLGGSVGTSVTGNTIANGRRGIIVSGAATQNDLSQNVLFGHSEIGIDLGNDLATPNDSADTDTGPNNLQNTPVVTAAGVISATELQITYFVNSLRAVVRYPLRVEFFATGDNQARVLLGTNIYTGADRAAGAKTIILSSVASLLSGDLLTATATDANGNTSELSLGFLITS